MIFNLYTIKDIVSEDHSSIFESVNHAVARRVTRKLLAQHGLKEEEVELYLVGSYDRWCGELVCGEKIRISLNDGDE